MKSNCAALFLVAMLLVGCRDAPPAEPETSATGPGDYLKNLSQAQQRATKTVDLAAVNKAVETFYVEEGRFPKDLLELVELDYLRLLPELADGAKWSYNPTNGVVTINREKP
jgi:hypothetical protein